MKTTLITLLLFSAICCAAASDQDSTKKAASLYVDFAAGFLPYDGAIATLIELSAGYRTGPKWGFGATLTGFATHAGESESASGIGVQARYTPFRRWIAKAGLGYVFTASHTSDGRYGYTYLPKSSDRIYFEGSVAFRFLRGLTLGISGRLSGLLAFRELDENKMATDIIVERRVSALALTLGFAIPGY